MRREVTDVTGEGRCEEEEEEDRWGEVPIDPLFGFGSKLFAQAELIARG